jgi:hypothetical protein
MLNRIGLIVLCLLPLVAGCIQTSGRHYSMTVDPKTGTPLVTVDITGADTQVADIEAKAPGGYSLKVTGLNVQDKVAAVSAQQNMMAIQVIGDLIGKIMPVVTGLLASQQEQTAAIREMVANQQQQPAAAKPVRPARKPKAATTQPAVKK